MAQTRTIEQQRVAADRLGFFSAMDVAVTAVLEDVANVREAMKRWPEAQHFGPTAVNVAFGAIRRLAFNELRKACMRHGEAHTKMFLELEHNIDEAANAVPGRVS
jgi:hypothetical protein